jgi:fumarate hydratase class II
MATGKTIKEVVVEKGLLPAEEVDKLIDARKLTEGGIQGVSAAG